MPPAENSAHATGSHPQQSASLTTVAPVRIGEQRYGGRLVYRARSDAGVVEVVDTGESRALHFGTSARQSGMWLDAPDRLQLPYTRALVSALYLCAEAPSRILLLGLGGGSLAKYLLQRYPACEIDAVDYSAEIIDVAQKYFALRRSPRLHIFCQDAAGFVRAGQGFRYDAILVDLFDAAGAAACTTQQWFLEACRAQLTARGVLALNLWRGRRTGFGATLGALRRVFGRRPLQLRVKHRANSIALISNDPDALRRFRRRTLLSSAPGPEFEEYAEQLHRQGGWLHRSLLWRLHPMFAPK